MCTAGTFPQIAPQTDIGPGSPAQPRARSVAIAPTPSLNTIHCSTELAGSAAQFNQSVSAMPGCLPGHSHHLLQGTADTLSKGSVQ
jgi:hypothetical protein